MAIYYCVTIIINIIIVVVFHKNINITALSILPLFLIALAIFQAIVFKKEKVENGFRTAYGSNLTADEENSMFSNCSTFLFLTIPWMIPFIIFFSSPIKALSILIYVVGMIGGLVLYKIKDKGKIINRMNAEKRELREQEQKEQLGKWK